MNHSAPFIKNISPTVCVRGLALQLVALRRAWTLPGSRTQSGSKPENYLTRSAPASGVHAMLGGVFELDCCIIFKQLLSTFRLLITKIRNNCLRYFHRSLENTLPFRAPLHVHSLRMATILQTHTFRISRSHQVLFLHIRKQPIGRLAHDTPPIRLIVCRPG
jgi:hypothetical protein